MGSRLEMEDFDREKRQVTADILKELHYRNVVTLSLHSVQDCVAYLDEILPWPLLYICLILLFV